MAAPEEQQQRLANFASISLLFQNAPATASREGLPAVGAVPPPHRRPCSSSDVSAKHTAAEASRLPSEGLFQGFDHARRTLEASYHAKLDGQGLASPACQAYTQMLPLRSSVRGSRLALSTSRVAPSTEEREGAAVIFLPAKTSLTPYGGCQKSTGCRPVPGMSLSNDATRRSHLRRIMNAIIRRRNQVAPQGSSSASAGVERFDVSSLEAGGGHQPEDLDFSESEAGLGPDKGQKRVLILMSDTGGGHRASAEALKATFELEFGDKYRISVVDAWKDHTPFPFNQMPKSYSFLVKHESLWRMAFHATKPRFVHQPQMAATSAFVAREVAKMLDIHRPDIIVSVHPLMQHIPLRVLRSRGLLHRIPFTTVITDLTTCHPTWFHKLATTCFCPTREVAQRALRAGLTPPQLRVHGLPTRPAFSQPPSLPQDELRKELGMDPDLPAVLLIGGGEGMGPVEATARALAKRLGGPGAASGGDSAGPIGQLVIVCGRNKKLKEKLEAIDWPMPTLVKGFVSNMPDVMAACTCIITKAGPGTIAESLIRGLPLVLNDFIAGQEVGNVPYVVDNGAGVFCDDPSKIATIVSEWFGPKAKEFAVMAQRAKELARPNAVFRIVRDLDLLACGEKLAGVDQRELAYL